MPLKVLALNCSLKPSPRDSSTDRILSEVLSELAAFDAKGEIERVVDYNVKPGVKDDEGDGDEWPRLREKIIAADIVVFGSPIWLGQPSSVVKRVLERLDAFLSDTDNRGRMPSFGKVAVVAVVGNEDGAHHVGAELFQALVEVGFTVPAAGLTYWVGEALGKVDYKDRGPAPEPVAAATKMLAANAAHLAALLKAQNYPGVPNS